MAPSPTCGLPRTLQVCLIYRRTSKSFLFLSKGQPTPKQKTSVGGGPWSRKQAHSLFPKIQLPYGRYTRQRSQVYLSIELQKSTVRPGEGLLSKIHHVCIRLSLCNKRALCNVCVAFLLLRRAAHTSSAKYNSHAQNAAAQQFCRGARSCVVAPVDNKIRVFCCSLVLCAAISFGVVSRGDGSASVRYCGMHCCVLLF